MRIAVVGKGGSGKSVVAGTIARVLARRGHRVLALDSDPIPGMAISLGLGPLTDAMLVEASEKNEQGRWKLKKGVGAARAVQRYSVIGPDGVRLLQFGKAGAEGLEHVMGSVNA
ncbi:MAG: AAA family ATPase, partial [Actinomycetota bacterium]